MPDFEPQEPWWVTILICLILMVGLGFLLWFALYGIWA